MEALVESTLAIIWDLLETHCHRQCQVNYGRTCYNSEQEYISLTVKHINCFSIVVYGSIYVHKLLEPEPRRYSTGEDRGYSTVEYRPTRK
jgi:hypothetical protein